MLSGSICVSFLYIKWKGGEGGRRRIVFRQYFSVTIFPVLKKKKYVCNEKKRGAICPT